MDLHILVMNKMPFRQTSFTKISQTFLTNQRSRNFQNVFMEVVKFECQLAGEWILLPVPPTKNKTREYGEK